MGLARIAKELGSFLLCVLLLSATACGRSTFLVQHAGAVSQSNESRLCLHESRFANRERCYRIDYELLTRQLNESNGVGDEVGPIRLGMEVRLLASHGEIVWIESICNPRNPNTPDCSPP